MKSEAIKYVEELELKLQNEGVGILRRLHFIKKELERNETDRKKAICFDVILRCNDVCPDNNKALGLSSYDSRYGSGHIDFLTIGKSIFIIEPKEHKLFEEYLHEIH